MRLRQAQTKAGVEIQHARQEMELEMYMAKGKDIGGGDESNNNIVFISL